MTIDRELFRLAVPAFAALISEPVMILIDTAIVGQLGTSELAALAAASTILMTIVGLCVFLAFGTTASVSRSVGAGDVDRAVSLGLTGVWLAVGIGVALAATVVLSAGGLSTALASSPEVADLAAVYLRWAALSIPGMLIVFATTGALRGMLDVKTPLLVMVAATCLNAPLTWWFVHGLHLGMAGAAAGLVIAQWFAAAWLLMRLVARRSRHVDWRPQPSPIVVAIRGAVPLLVRSLTLRAALLLATWVAAGSGDAPLAAHQIITALVTLLAFALDALAIAAQALVGTNLGAGDVERARAVSRRAMWWGMIGGALIGAGVAMFAAWVVGLFTDSPTVIDVAIPALLVAAAVQPISGVVFALDGILIGAGDANYLAWAGVITLLAYAPAALLVAHLGASLAWLWVAYGVFQLARLVTLAWRERGTRWLVTGANIP